MVDVVGIVHTEEVQGRVRWGVSNAVFFGTVDGLTAQNYSIQLPQGTSLTIFWGDYTADTYEGIGWDEDWTYNIVDGVAVPPDAAYNISVTHTYAQSGSYEIRLRGDVEELRILELTQRKITANAGRFPQLFPKLVYLRCGGNYFSGDITNWYQWEFFDTVVAPNMSWTCDLSKWVSSQSIRSFNISNSPVGGDISDLTDMPNISAISLASTVNLQGDITSWNISQLQQLTFYNSTSVAGNISGWSGPNLVYFILAGSPLTGDVSWISGSPNLMSCRCEDSDLTYDTTASWSNIRVTYGIRFDGSNWTSTMVDNALIAMAGGPVYNTTINLGGNNAARTSASDSAKATLLANGCSITVNE